jgi:hypothetical protein
VASVRDNVHTVLSKLSTSWTYFSGWLPTAHPNSTVAPSATDPAPANCARGGNPKAAQSPLAGSSMTCALTGGLPRARLSHCVAMRKHLVT